MKKLFIIFLIISLQCLAQDPPTASVKKLTRGDSDYLNGINIGMITSSMAACAGKNNDSKTIYTAGIMLLMGEVLNFEVLKKLQQDTYQYGKDDANLANNSQVTSIAGEVLKNKKDIYALLRQKEKLQKGALSAFLIAEGEAKQGLINIMNAKAACYKDIWYAAEMPIELDLGNGKVKIVYGMCRRIGGDTLSVADGCKGYVAMKKAYIAAGRSEEDALLKDSKGPKGGCQKAYRVVEALTRMSIGSPDNCATKCYQASREMFDCTYAIRDFKKNGFPAIEALSNKYASSTDHTAEILDAHKKSFINAYKICGRAALLKKLKSINSKGATIDSHLLEFNSESQRIGSTVGGQANSNANRARTDRDRMVKQIHGTSADKSNTLITEVGSFRIKEENIYNKMSFSPNKDGGITPMCSDGIARTCGKYSELLMKSLDGCSETLNSTSYAFYTKEILNTVQEMLPSGIIINPKLYQKFFITGEEFLLNSVYARSSSLNLGNMTHTIGTSLGMGATTLDALSLGQKKMVNLIDPYLSTYNKRIVIYGVAANIVRRMIKNTQENIVALERQVSGIQEMVKAYYVNKSNIKYNSLQKFPRLSAAITKIAKNPVIQSKVFIDLSRFCKNKNCSYDYIPPLDDNSDNLSLENAKQKISEGSQTVAEINKQIQSENQVGPIVRKKIESLGYQSNHFQQVNEVLEKQIQDFNRIKIEKKKILNKLDRLKHLLVKSQKHKVDLLEQADQSIYYKEKKNNKEKKEIAKESSIQNPVDQTSSGFENTKFIFDDIEQGKKRTIWDIISSRYLKMMNYIEFKSQ